jgi:hypothetical protein
MIGVAYSAVHVLDLVVRAEEVVIHDLVSLAIVFILREGDVLSLWVLFFPLRLAVIVVVDLRVSSQGPATRDDPALLAEGATEAE